MFEPKILASPKIKEEDAQRSVSEFETSRLSPERGKSNSKGKRAKGRRRRRNRQIEKYIESKMCEICQGQESEECLLLCDRCDDSFHTYCLSPPLTSLPEKEWICSICVKQIEQNRFKREKQKEKQLVQTECHRCNESLTNNTAIKGFNKHGAFIEKDMNTLTSLRCLYCKHRFHSHCFSQRMNSLNCWTCEQTIRKQGPKCHDDFMNFIDICVKSVKQNETCRFTTIPIQQQNDTNKRHRYFRLKVPIQMTSWQSIVENQASIYYAFKTKGLTFIDDQLYEKQHKEYMMTLNDPRKDINGPIHRLHEKDEKVYEQFKVNAERGYVGPFEVKQDRVKGFYLIATEFIQPLTIISQYLGEVKTARIAINFQENDSIFLLVRSARSKSSLDIVPQKYGNISRFFLGINNEYKRIHGSINLQNVKSLRFSYRGRVRLLLYTSKPIQAGQTLYFNYNGSAFHEYPTEHFVL